MDSVPASLITFSRGKWVRRSWLRLFWAGVFVCGAVLAYLVTSGVGDRLLHAEIETQLSRLLGGPVEIAEVQLRFENGLLIEAHGVQAFPDPTGGPPVLRTSRVLARVDLVAILVGRLELSTLVLEGPQLRIERRPDGSLVGFPLPRVAQLSEDTSDTPFLEEFTQRLEALDATTRNFLETFHAADRIDVLDGSITWIDHQHQTIEGTPRTLRLELISGSAVRDWLSEAAELEGRGVFVDGKHTPFPIEWTVHRDELKKTKWTLSVSQTSREQAKPPLSVDTDRGGFGGFLDARFTLMTSETGLHRLDLDGVIRDPTLRLRRSVLLDIDIDIENKIDFQIAMEFDRKQVRVSRGRLAGHELALEFKAALDRPMLADSKAHIESRLLGADLTGVRDLALQLETEFTFARAIARLTENLQEGRLRYLEVAGTAELQSWLDLMAGDTDGLPDGFRLIGGFEELVIDSDSGERIENLSGEIDWVGDRISLRKWTGLYLGESTPTVNASFTGVQRFLQIIETQHPVQTAPPLVPGIVPFLKIFEPRDPDAPDPVRNIDLFIDYLDHPIFHFPLRNLQVQIQPGSRHLAIQIQKGTWGGGALQGNITWEDGDTTSTINADLSLNESPIGSPDHSLATAKSTPGLWGAGQFDLTFRPSPSLPFTTATGAFALDGADLTSPDLEIQLSPKGTASLKTTIGLSDAESIELDLSFGITGATLEGMSEFVVLPPDLTTGNLTAAGELTGRVQPAASFIAELDGKVRIEASDGLIRTHLPLLLRLGKATEGYNPFANADELDYESMTGTLELSDGRLRIEDFELEGPLRVYANVRLDTNESPGRIRAIVGIFLFRRPNQIFSSIPLVKSFLPGSDRGLIGAYYKVKGPLDDPKVDPLPLKTLLSSVPDAIKAPLKTIQFLFGLGDKDP
ncbi:MAG: AsmA-like C-terminal region-containing protein [Myxococcota bacterium]